MEITFWYYSGMAASTLHKIGPSNCFSRRSQFSYVSAGRLLIIAYRSSIYTCENLLVCVTIYFNGEKQPMCSFKINESHHIQNYTEAADGYAYTTFINTNIYKSLQLHLRWQWELLSNMRSNPSATKTKCEKKAMLFLNVPSPLLMLTRNCEAIILESNKDQDPIQC